MKTPKLLILVLVLPAMAAGFFTVLGREIGQAFKYAYLEACRELDAAKRAWRE